MSKAIVICHGYLGDHLFASSIAQKLIEEEQFTKIDYVVGFPQVIPLLQLNPYIRQVFFDGIVTPSPRPYILSDKYDKIIQLGPLSFYEPPCVEFQKIAGVKNPSPEFKVWTDRDIDHLISDHFRDVNRPLLAILDNWQPKTFLFTREQYKAGIDVPNLGYGGSWRNTKYIVEQLKKEYSIIFVGAPAGISQYDTADKKIVRTLLEEASVLKNVDFCIGSDSGICNLAAGVGCKTILTSDYVKQLYGENGVIRKIKEPKLGPSFYFPTGHIDLDPYLTDVEVVENIKKIINGYHK